MQAREMIATHPDVRGNVDDALIRCIEQCYSCAQTCTACADACLAGKMLAEMRQCIRLCLDCADVCAAAGSVASRRTGGNEGVIAELLNACAVACRLCADECGRHGDHHDHCRICAEQCRRCAEACSEAVKSVRGGS